MFEDLRRSLDEMLQRATKPEDRRAVVSRMKSTLVQAKLGVDDLRVSLEESRRKLERERRELETVQRRKELAAAIPDAETVTVAERFERHHQERVAMLEQKLTVQVRELELAERELGEMKAELRTAMAGAPATGRTTPIEDPLEEDAGSRTREEIDALARERARTDRDREADRRLEELKRRIGGDK